MFNLVPETNIQYVVLPVKQMKTDLNYPDIITVAADVSGILSCLPDATTEKGDSPSNSASSRVGGGGALLYSGDAKRKPSSG